MDEADPAKEKAWKQQFVASVRLARKNRTIALLSVEPQVSVFSPLNHLPQTSASSSVETTIIESARQISSFLMERRAHMMIRINSVFLENVKITGAISADK